MSRHVCGSLTPELTFWQSLLMSRGTRGVCASVSVSTIPVHVCDSSVGREGGEKGKGESRISWAHCAPHLIVISVIP